MVFLKGTSEEYDNDSDMIYYQSYLQNVGAGNALDVKLQSIEFESNSNKIIEGENFGNENLFSAIQVSQKEDFYFIHPYTIPNEIKKQENYVFTFSFEDILGNKYFQKFKYPIDITNNHDEYKGSFHGSWLDEKILVQEPQLQ